MFKPMKPPTGKLNLDDVTYPVYVSIKYDGFRVAKRNGKTVLNSLRELDNLHARAMIEQYPELDNRDGELVMLPLNDNECFSRCQSAFRRASGEPDFRFVVFDHIVEGISFEDRWVHATHPTYPDWVIVYRPVLVENREQLDEVISEILEDNHEGAILRRPSSKYKFGRGTFKEQQLLRVKPMETDEARIVGFECSYENTNPAEKNNLGRTKRSSAKEGLVPKDTLGKLICEHAKWGIIKVSGFRAQHAKLIWDNQPRYLGELATFAFQACGSIDKPRILKFKGLRCVADMSA